MFRGKKWEKREPKELTTKELKRRNRMLSERAKAGWRSRKAMQKAIYPEIVYDPSCSLARKKEDPK
jgi:hypothetical protein